MTEVPESLFLPLSLSFLHSHLTFTFLWQPRECYNIYFELAGKNKEWQFTRLDSGLNFLFLFPFPPVYLLFYLTYNSSLLKLSLIKEEKVMVLYTTSKKFFPLCKGSGISQQVQ